MAAYPVQLNTASSHWKICQAGDCGKAFTQYRSLTRHLAKDHGIAVPTWLKALELQERTPAGLGDNELESVRLCYADDGSIDESAFRCVRCDKAIRGATPPWTLHPPAGEE